MVRSLQNQLQPLQADMRVERPEVRPVVQIHSHLAGNSVMESVRAAQECVLSWLENKQRVTAIPKDAWEGAPFEIDATQGKPVSVETADAFWALRYEKPDDEVPGRQWRTEVVLGWRDDEALLGVRLTVISQRWNEPYSRSVPRLVSDLVRKPGLEDYGFSVSDTPWRVVDVNAVQRLVELLESRARARPAFVISADNHGAYAIDGLSLARRCAGLAHVVLLTTDSAWELSNRIGPRLSVYGGAIRTYRPGFDHYSARFEDHQVATREWLERRFEHPGDFIDVIVNGAIDQSVSGGDLESKVPSFVTIRRALASRRLHEGRTRNASDSELLALYEDDNEKLKEEAEEAWRYADEIDQQRKLEEEIVTALKSEAHNYRQRISQLENALKVRGTVESIEYPDSLQELEEWAARYLAGRLVLLPRAIRGARKAEFEDVRLVCDALLLLGRQYCNYRRGELTGEEYETARAALRVEISPTGDRARLMQWREEYEVSLPRGGKAFLDWHVKKGTARDPRRSLRIYFLWDEDQLQVVVGHLPDHLTNDLT